jgi:hypothetical protein
MNFFKLVQNKLNMSSMFFHVLGKNENVIDVTNDEINQVFMGNIIHQMLKNSKCINKAKRHDHIFKMAIRGLKNNLPFITFSNIHQVICTT